jgi:hypothetical protein
MTEQDSLRGSKVSFGDAVADKPSYDLELEANGGVAKDIALHMYQNNDGSNSNIHADGPSNVSSDVLRGSLRREGAKIESTVTPNDRKAALNKAKSVKIRRATAGLQSVAMTSERERIQEEQAKGATFIILPWSPNYKIWWYLTVIGASLTIFTETYNIAFARAGMYPYTDAASCIEYVLLFIFLIDMLLMFHLAYFDEETNDVVMDTKKIVNRYFSGLFWVDICGIFPFYAVLLAAAGELGEDSKRAQYMALFRLSRMVRLRRLKQLFDIMQFNSKISLMTMTLSRNFVFALVWSHFSACVLYFIARVHDFDPEKTWIGGSVEGMSALERYVTSLYWSVVTFTTVGKSSMVDDKTADLARESSAKQLSSFPAFASKATETFLPSIPPSKFGGYVSC